MRFSQRIGKRKIKTELEKEGLSDELRNSLWTLILELIIEVRSNEKRYDQHYSDLSVYFRDLWIHFYKWPIDNLPMSYGTVSGRATDRVRVWFFKSDWDLVLDFIEFSSDYHSKF